MENIKVHSDTRPKIVYHNHSREIRQQTTASNNEVLPVRKQTTLEQEYAPPFRHNHSLPRIQQTTFQQRLLCGFDSVMEQLGKRMESISSCLRISGLDSTAVYAGYYTAREDVWNTLSTGQSTSNLVEPEKNHQIQVPHARLEESIQGIKRSISRKDCKGEQPLKTYLAGNTGSSTWHSKTRPYLGTSGEFASLYRPRESSSSGTRRRLKTRHELNQMAHLRITQEEPPRITDSSSSDSDPGEDQIPRKTANKLTEVAVEAPIIDEDETRRTRHGCIDKEEEFYDVVKAEKLVPLKSFQKDRPKIPHKRRLPSRIKQYSNDRSKYSSALS